MARVCTSHGAWIDTKRWCGCAVLPRSPTRRPIHRGLGRRRQRRKPRRASGTPGLLSSLDPNVSSSEQRATETLIPCEDSKSKQEATSNTLPVCPFHMIIGDPEPNYNHGNFGPRVQSSESGNIVNNFFFSFLLRPKGSAMCAHLHGTRYLQDAAPRGFEAGTRYTSDKRPGLSSCCASPHRRCIGSLPGVVRFFTIYQHR